MRLCRHWAGNLSHRQLDACLHPTSAPQGLTVVKDVIESWDAGYDTLGITNFAILCHGNIVINSAYDGGGGVVDMCQCMIEGQVVDGDNLKC